MPIAASFLAQLVLVDVPALLRPTEQPVAPPPVTTTRAEPSAPPRQPRARDPGEF